LPQDVDGGSIVPLLRNGGEGRVQRVLEGLVFHRPSRNRNLSSSVLRQGDFKLHVFYLPDGSIRSRHLYEVKNDPFETKDLAQAEPARADSLEKILMNYLRVVKAQTPRDLGR